MLDVFFFKQKTAYEMRISDWSSDVCSSDLDRAQCRGDVLAVLGGDHHAQRIDDPVTRERVDLEPQLVGRQHLLALHREDRKSDVWGKSVSVRVDLGGRRIIKKKKQHTIHKPYLTPHHNTQPHNKSHT